MHECAEGHSYEKNDLCEVAAKEAKMRAYNEYEETGKTHKELVKRAEQLNEKENAITFRGFGHTYGDSSCYSDHSKKVLE